MKKGGEYYMTTVINNPPSQQSDSGGGIGMIMGAVVLLVVGYLFFVYGLPAMRQVDVTPQINVPENIDVNVNQGQ